MGSDYLGKVVLKSESFMENGCNKDIAMEEAGTKWAYLGLKIKVKGQEQYPDGQPPEFEAEVDKGEGAKVYGLDVDSQDDKHLQVVGVVDAGAFKEYNERNADPSVQVIKSDFIVSVNGLTGRTEMLNAFKESKITVKVVRAINTAVLVENTDKKKGHGLIFPEKMKCDVLVVMKIEDGYIKEYNDKCKHASEKIHVYDRIFSVKGQEGKAALLKGLLDKATDTFQLAIQRPCPPAGFW